MREAFARWARPNRNPVTQTPVRGLQHFANDIHNVTLVTLVTQTKQQAPLCAESQTFSEVESNLVKSRVTRVTRVTRHDSLDNLCNPIQEAKVTGLQDKPKAMDANVEAPARPNHSSTPEQESWACWCCGGQQYFLNTAGQPICVRCHPPVDPIRFTIH